MTSGSVHKHKDKKDKKKKTKKKKKSNKSSHVEDSEINYGGSGDEITDLNEEMHSIGYYINDRDEMINQMFSVIKPDKLRAMLPPILKESTIEELKAYCLDELLGMSYKRINSVLEGRELETSSESDDASSVAENDHKSRSSSPVGSENQWSSDEGKSEEAEVTTEDVYAVEERGGPANDMDTLEIGITNEEMGELLNCMPSNQKNERKRRQEDQEPSTSTSKKGKWKLKKSKDTENGKKAMKKDSENDKKAMQKDSENDKIDCSEKIAEDDRNESTTETNTEESKGKTLLEILELEMRARAIRALLKQQVGTSEGDEASGSNAPSEKDSSEPPTTVTEDAKESLNLSLVSKSLSSQDCNSGVHSAISSDVNAKSTKKKLKQNTLKPADTSLQQCTSKSLPKDDALDTDVSDSLPTSESRNEDSIKDTREEISTDCSMNLIIKAEVPNDEQTVPDLESNREDEENKIPVTDPNLENDERDSLKDREDGELSSDGEKSSDSILEIQPDGGCSDIIVLDDSEDELMVLNKNSSLTVKKVTSSSTENNKQAESCETEEIIEILELQEQETPCNKHEDGKISKRRENLSKKGSLDCVTSEVSCSDQNENTPSNLDKKSAKEMKDSAVVDDTNPKVQDCTKNDSSKKNEAMDVSWAARWLQSKGVQKVVSTSKMCAKIRNRMKSAQKEKKINAETPQRVETKKQSVVIVGSVNEYNMLDKPKSSQKESCGESE